MVAKTAKHSILKHLTQKTLTDKPLIKSVAYVLQIIADLVVQFALDVFLYNDNGRLE